MPPNTDHAPPSIHVDLIAAADLRAVPWKNGGGVTREIASHPGNASFESFLWRISVADVAQAGPFSTFHNIDRTLVVTRGGPMILIDEAGGEPHRLSRWEPHRFLGETPIRAELPNGPTQDFNLMVRRGAGTGRLDVRETAQTLTLEPGCTALHCAAGSFGIRSGDMGWRDAPDMLQTGDTLIVTLSGEAALRLAIEPAGAGDDRLIDVRIRLQGDFPCRI
ncbi:HutD family protein [Paralcaligenes sp. KSB-10]|uniref:HutD/Ves family protein n=1 Tax=Paralcaligenes sp. KSB-10 TaxID=2901142 RepID=UPI001E373AF2|nr:HutD family protein [Paralcaligenes sp. KSB-10]UHL63729.1 HutD family protein [Paralcaligenes sp. KSB-10]